MAILLLVLLNAVLYIRPAEFIPQLVALPLYQVVLACCLIVSFHVVLEQLGPQSLSERPITACVIVIWAAVAISELAHFRIADAINSAWTFYKVVLYYLLLAGVLDSRARLQWFLASMVVSDAVVAGVAVLDFHGVVSLPNLNKFGHIGRLGSTGLFGDPNDMCTLLVQAMILSVYLMGRSDQFILLRLLWLGPLALFGHAFTMTNSRGGFISLVAAVLAFIPARYGRRAIPLAFFALPALFALFAGRQTDIDVSSSTGQSRIHLWDIYLSIFRRNPFFGVGFGNSANYHSHVAHNAFISTYAELGFLGGMFIVGVYYLAMDELRDYARRRVRILDPEMARLRPYLMACVAAYVFGMMSLSRQYAIPSYNVLGLVVAYRRITATDPPLPPRRFDARLVGTFAVLGVAFYFLMLIYVRRNANYY